MAYGHGLGWVDADGDGINDRFCDPDGDAVNECGHGPYYKYRYRHGYLGPHVAQNGDRSAPSSGGGSGN
jgi:hypothetical protein